MEDKKRFVVRTWTVHPVTKLGVAIGRPAAVRMMEQRLGSEVTLTEETVIVIRSFLEGLLENVTLIRQVAEDRYGAIVGWICAVDED